MLAITDTWLQPRRSCRNHEKAKSQLELQDLPFSPEAWCSLLGFRRDTLAEEMFAFAVARKLCVWPVAHRRLHLLQANTRAHFVAKIEPAKCHAF